jgi:hypothetical protein
MLLNAIAAELLFIVAFAAALIYTWPHPPWTLLTYLAAAGVVLFPMALYPFARSAWLAFDLYFRPVEQHERSASAADRPEPPQTG